MRHDDHRRALLGELLHHGEHLADELGIKRRGWFVKEDHIGLCGNGAGDADALLLSARELCGVVVGTLRHPHTPQSIHADLLCLCRRHAAPDGEPEGHILDGSLIREEVVVLKDEARLFPHSGNLALGGIHEGKLRPVEVHRPAIGMLKEVETAQECRLARAARPEDDDHIPLVHAEAHILQNLDLCEALAYVLYSE